MNVKAQQGVWLCLQKNIVTSDISEYLYHVL